MKHFKRSTIASFWHAGSENVTGKCRKERFLLLVLSQMQLEQKRSRLFDILSFFHKLQFTNDLGIPKAILWVSHAEGQWEQDENVLWFSYSMARGGPRVESHENNILKISWWKHQGKQRGHTDLGKGI